MNTCLPTCGLECVRLNPDQGGKAHPRHPPNIASPSRKSSAFFKKPINPPASRPPKSGGGTESTRGSSMAGEDGPGPAAESKGSRWRTVGGRTWGLSGIVSAPSWRRSPPRMWKSEKMPEGRRVSPPKGWKEVGDAGWSSSGLGPLLRDSVISRPNGVSK